MSDRVRGNHEFTTTTRKSLKGTSIHGFISVSLSGYGASGLRLRISKLELGLFRFE
jgi:hypothetical protein